MQGQNGNSHSEAQQEKFRQGVGLLHQGRAEEAAELLEELYSQDPGHTEVALNLGGAYILQQRYDEAEDVLEPATKAAPDNANLWVNLAAAQLGPLEKSSEAQQDRAIAAYQRALAANPEAPNVHYMLGLIHHFRNDYLRAVAHFTRAVEQDPQDNDARRMLAATTAEHLKGRGNG